MIDTHCHLTDERLGAQLEDVLTRARAAGVTRFITISTSVEDARACVAVARGRDEVRCTVGIHPNYSQHADLSHMPMLREIQSDASVVALGEMGLDYFHKFADRRHQAELFRAQLQLARDVGKPVVIHCREAVDDTLAIMADFADVPAVFHCFTGTPDEARRILDRGYLLGFTGPVTYKRNDALRDVARFVPDDRFVVETDAPYLSPEPVRSVKTNEPAFVMHTAAAIARERGVTLDALDALTTANARRFFRWE